MFLRSLDDLFGPLALGHGLFYRHSPALRFELSDGVAPIDQFSRAYDRARTIAEVAFGTSERVTVVLACDSYTGKERAVMVRAARSCGVDIPRMRENGTQPADVESEAIERSLIAFEARRDVLPRLLWGALAQELGVRPRLFGELYLADLDRGILLHPYDDRGMDVIGPGIHVLSGLYTNLTDWLLAYDLERMHQFFAQH